jgi:cupin fold WbuC family metalloprotein
VPLNVQQLDRNLIARVTEAALKSPRRRMNFNFHSGPEDNPHRFLNVLLKGTYVQPHRHLRPPKDEAFLALSGEGCVITFDDAGIITGRHFIGDCHPSIGVDTPAGVWHTVVALSDVLVCYEVKPGPWNPSTDKEFAAWAPAEESPDVERYLSAILNS